MDPDPALFFSDFQGVIEKYVFFSQVLLTEVHLHQSSKTRSQVIKTSQNCRNQGTFKIFFAMSVKGQGSVQIITDLDLKGPKTFRSGSRFCFLTPDGLSHSIYLSYIHLGSSVCLSSCLIPVILSSCHICGTLSYSLCLRIQTDRVDETEGLEREELRWRDRKETDRRGRV